MKRCITLYTLLALLVLVSACSTKKDSTEQPRTDDVYMGDAPPPEPIDQDILADDYGTGAIDLPPEATTPAGPAYTYTPPAQDGYVSPLPPTSTGYPDYTSGRSSGGGTAAGGSYTVKRGDSLWSISRRHGTTVNALANANNISTTGVLREGQRLTIPGGSGTAASVSSSTSGGGRTYRVQAGDSYYKIARKYGIGTQKLMEYNNATSPNLREGQTLRIP